MGLDLSRLPLRRRLPLDASHEDAEEVPAAAAMAVEEVREPVLDEACGSGGGDGGYGGWSFHLSIWAPSFFKQQQAGIAQHRVLQTQNNLFSEL
jgi:hypothetical protein